MGGRGGKREHKRRSTSELYRDGTVTGFLEGQSSNSNRTYPLGCFGRGTCQVMSGTSSRSNRSKLSSRLFKVVGVAGIC